MLDLHIRQQDAQLGLHVTNPQIHLKTTEPAVKIHSEAATVEIHQPDGKVKIDSTGFYSALGQKPSLDVDRQNAQAALSHAAEVAQEDNGNGHSILETPSGSGVIVRQIAAKALSHHLDYLTLTSTPNPSVKFDESGFSVHVRPGKLDIQLQKGEVSGSVDQGEVHAELTRQTSIQIWFTDSHINLEV